MVLMTKSVYGFSVSPYFQKIQWLGKGLDFGLREFGIKSNRFLCATIYNTYQYMVTVVKTSMNLNQDLIYAHCSFRIAETIEDCEFPSSGTIGIVYMGPIIAIGAVLIITIIVLCDCWYCKPMTGEVFFLKINLNYALETMHWLSLAGCTNWVIRLQTGVKWLFLTWFKVCKEPKGPDMSSFIVKTASLVIKKPFGGNKSVYKAVGSFIDCTSCTCQASTT